jgi:hypothetical protein
MDVVPGTPNLPVPFMSATDVVFILERRGGLPDLGFVDRDPKFVSLRI